MNAFGGIEHIGDRCGGLPAGAARSRVDALALVTQHLKKQTEVGGGREMMMDENGGARHAVALNITDAQTWKTRCDGVQRGFRGGWKRCEEGREEGERSGWREVRQWCGFSL